MAKYKIIIEYDGTDFVGWQKQENGPSIQSSIEDAIKKLTSENVNVFGAGRTDSGVHAKGQVAHFEFSKNISLDNIRDGINQHLRPLPIAILDVKEVNDDFHARFSAKLRTYKYLIINRRAPLTFNKNLAWGVFKKLNIDAIVEAASIFVGKHDFNAFRSIDCQSSSSIKTILSCSIETNDQHIILNVSAKSFLHSQVRIMVGTLVEVGKGKFNSSDVKNIIKSRDRSKAGATAPAQGLYLLKVEY
ncbi:MAG: tRNA pseudouridine(38-40) synthase TruA [SAR202 cluster bacterium]|jgi:tRNA pseudouridine38-40 synthase|nr:tRNA pseudouridine(38-40) synthase TruA [SAR202 cluster bacterium]